MNTIYVKCWSEIPDNYTGIIDWYGASILHYKNGKEHREDGPAIIHHFIGFTGRQTCYCLNGFRYSSKEYWFEHLTEEQKLRALWNINE